MADFPSGTGQKPIFTPKTDNKPQTASPFSSATQEKPRSLYTPRQPSTFGGTFTATSTAAQQKPESRPFASLRAQSQPTDTARTSPLSRFTRPAATQPAQPVSRFATTADRPASTFSRPATTAGAATTRGTLSTAKPASPFRKDLHITDEEFLLLRDFIYQQCGIFIAENRIYLVENRLSNRLKELNLKSYNIHYNF